MSTIRPMKIPPRPQTNGGSTRRWPWSSSGSQSSSVVRRKAWYLMTCVCCEMTDDNIEQLRHKLAVCQAVKTEVKMTSSALSWGRRGRGHRIKRIRIPMEAVQSVEQDEVFVNVLLCFFRLVDMPDNINYQIAAFKFHDTADVRALVWAFQSWTGAGPIDKAPSIVNGTMMMRSMGGGSMHSLAMPGRPTSSVLAPDRWVAVDRNAPRRYNSASVGDLTAMSDVFYPTNGSRAVQRNGTLQGSAAVPRATNGTSMTNGYRYRSSAEQQTLTSDEGNGSLSFSDNNQQPVNNQRQSRATMRSEAEVSSSEPLIPADEHPGLQNNRPINASGIASVYTGDGGGSTTGAQSARLTRSSGIGRDDDEDYDEMSTVSGMSSAFDDEPGLSSRYRGNPVGSPPGVMTNGHGVSYGNENRNGGIRRSYNDVIDEEDVVDSYNNGGGRYVEPMRINIGAIANKSSNVRRVYSRPGYSGSEGGFADNDDFVNDYPTATSQSHRSRFYSNSREFQNSQQRQMPPQQVPYTRSRSAGPLQPRYSRSDIGINYQPNGTMASHINNDDAMSIAASTMSVNRGQSTALINPNFEKRYATRQQPVQSVSSMYRQAPRPVHVSSGSGYGGVRSRTMSHRIH